MKNLLRNLLLCLTLFTTLLASSKIISFAEHDTPILASNSLILYTDTLSTLVAANSIPSISGIDPSQPVRNPSRQTITIRGSGFRADSAVKFVIKKSEYIIPPERITYVNSSQIRVLVGLTDSGYWSVQVTNPSNKVSNSYSFYVVESVAVIPTPSISGIDPSQPVKYHSQQTISIRGSDFTADSAVKFTINRYEYDIPKNRITYVNSNQIKVNVGLTDSGYWNVQVTNPGNKVSNNYSFYVAELEVVAPTLFPSSNPTSEKFKADEEYFTLINKLLEEAAKEYELPPVLLKAIAYVESNWRHYNSDGSVKVGIEKGKNMVGLGIMQITVKDNPDDANFKLLKDEIKYNIYEGARILYEKKLTVGKANPTNKPVDDPELIENWWYTTVYYNGTGTSIYGLTGMDYAEKVREVILCPPDEIKKFMPKNAGWTFPHEVFGEFELYDFFRVEADGTFTFKPKETKDWNKAVTKKDLKKVHNWKEFTYNETNSSMNVKDEMGIFLDYLPIPTDVSPFEKLNTVFLPVRVIAERLGGIVGWEGDTKTVTITLNKNNIELNLDSRIILVNQKPLILSMLPTSKEGRTMVPVDFFEKSFGMLVDWVKGRKRVDFISETEKTSHTSYSDTIINKFSIGNTVEIFDTGGSGLRLCSIAGDSSQNSIIWLMPDYTHMKVIGGPLIVDDSVWWELSGNNKIGYAADTWLKEIEPVEDSRIEMAINWALDWSKNKSGDTSYSKWCLRFVTHAYSMGASLYLDTTGWDCAFSAASILEARSNRHRPIPRGAYVFYDWTGILNVDRKNYGHVGIALEDGDFGEIAIVHAHGTVKVDNSDLESKYKRGYEYVGWAWPDANKITNKILQNVPR